MIQRRSFISGLGTFLAAPAIVRAASLMPVRRAPLVAYRLPDDFTIRTGHIAWKTFNDQFLIIGNVDGVNYGSPVVGKSLRIRLPHDFSISAK
jgi:hypothetical protein